MLPLASCVLFITRVEDITVACLVKTDIHARQVKPFLSVLSASNPVYLLSSCRLSHGIVQDSTSLKLILLQLLLTELQARYTVHTLKYIDLHSNSKNLENPK